MSRRYKVEPWIERMIISHDTDKQTTMGRLKAHVIGLGQMSDSQAQGRTEGPTRLLLFSDGVVHIPAMLTQSAWETLQDQEDRECLTSLVNNTVCVNLLRLQFYMAAEQTKCMFFLLVGELATTAVGSVKDNTPCCTTLTSVNRKICQMWRSLLGQEDYVDSQTSQQYGSFDLSELLDEWHRDCIEDLLQDARERLRILRTHQPSTSSGCNPPPLPSHTGWDADRVRYKREEHFTIPVPYLLIPDEEIPQPQTPLDEGSETPSGLLIPPEDRLTESPPIAAQCTDPAHPVSCDSDEPMPSPESVLIEVVVSELRAEERRDNPWDIFTTPTDLLSASTSDEAQTPEGLLNRQSPSLLDVSKPASPEVQSEPTAIATGTQIPSQGSSSVTRTLGGMEGDLSLLPPYQKQRPTTTPSPAGPACELSSSLTPPGLALSSDTETQLHRRRQWLETDVEVQEEEMEVVKRKSRKAKGKSRERTGSFTPAEEDKEEAQRAHSPPSWLFESPEGSRTVAANSRRQSPPAPAGTLSKRTPTVHSDGTLFSYSYKLSGHTSLALGRFQVAGDTLQWAVRYLVPPKQTDHRDL